MNKILLAIALSCVTLSGYAQKKDADAKYEANEYDVKKSEKAYSYKSTGQMFKSRMDAFWKISNDKTKNFINTADYNKFLKNFEQLQYSGNDKIARRLNNFIASVKAASTTYLSIDNYRNKVYQTAVPVSVAVEEDWGDDVMEVVLSDSWRKLHSYVTSLAKDDYRLADVAATLNENMANDLNIMNENSRMCTYNVQVDKPLQKDKFDIYFVESRIASLIQTLGLYPQDRMLAGPIANHGTMRAESENLMYFLNNAKKDKANNIHYVKIAAKATTGAQENLNESTEWYMYAFRNGVLFYSYMALPCSRFNTVTLKEMLIPKDFQAADSAAAAMPK